ncbi:hypothetical protein [Agreia sp.]|uniref:hypothetical protein n=1 Tax=Agreia sp. TaxID=1872416 RepID=UPI0035BBEF41
MRFLSFGRANNPELAKTDQGSGSLDDYLYDLVPRNKRVRIQLADSDPCQDALRLVLEQGVTEPEAFIARRSIADERTDAPTPVRLFVNQRPTPVVGFVPRGLEAPVEAALARLADSGKSTRMQATVRETKRGIRVDLAIGQTR